MTLNKIVSSLCDEENCISSERGKFRLFNIGFYFVFERKTNTKEEKGGKKGGCKNFIH